MQVAQEFDPYHKWLGIAPAEQPPTLYRLLGLQQFEADADVIHASADRQTAFLRTVQAGAQAARAAQLLNEVAAARICLSNPQQRANYDAVLRSAAPADAAVSPTQQAPAVAEPALKAGAPFGALDIVESVRNSQFGNIYKARHRASGRLVSLKVLPKESAKNREVLHRFEREQKVSLSLKHPNLIAGYAAGVEQGFPYLVTEFVVGTDLATLIAQQGTLPSEQAVDFLLQAARGLTQLHMHGIYHRNIKPEVLFVDMQGRIKVTSLFLARLDEFASVGGGDEDLTRMGQMMGTPEYMAPEQAANAKSVDGRADIYALGCTLHFMLTGRPPYGGKSLMEKLVAHRKSPIPKLADARPDVSKELEKVFQKMLAKEPEARYRFMGDAVAALEAKKPSNLLQKLLRFFSPKGG